MTKEENLQLVTANLYALADSLQELCDSLKATGDVEPEAKKKIQPKKKAITLEEVRGKLAELSRNGKIVEVRGLIQKYGGNKLSDLDATHYEAVLKEAEELANGK